MEKVRWFLLPEEAWEYGHGRTAPITQASFQPKHYQKKGEPQRQGSVRSAPTKRKHAGLSRGRRFFEDDHQHSDHEEATAAVGDLVTVRTTVNTRWAAEPGHAGTDPTSKSHTTPHNHHNSLLSSPAVTWHKAKKIKKKITHLTKKCTAKLSHKIHS